jgi:hypothetical protein
MVLRERHGRRGMAKEVGMLIRSDAGSLDRASVRIAVLRSLAVSALLAGSTIRLPSVR